MAYWIARSAWAFGWSHKGPARAHYAWLGLAHD